jgi:hypothetical protein
MAGVPQQGIAAPVDVPAATPLPMRSPSSFGADVGAGLEQLGGQLEQDQVRAKNIAAHRQYQVDASAAGVAAAEAQSDVAQQIDAIREQAAPGAAGHVEAVGKAIDDRFGEVLSTITNPVLRGQFAEDLARTKARLVSDESGWAAGQRVAYQVSNVQQTAQTLGNTILAHPDQGTFDDSIHTLATSIGNQGLAADKSEKLLRDQAQDLAVARAKGLTITDPAQALTWLGSDDAGTWLPADKRAALIDEAQTALRVQAADQRRQVAQAAAAVRVDAQALEAKINQGVLVSDDDISGIVGRAQALQGADPGLANVLEGLRYDQGKLKYSRLTDKWTSTEWEQNINTLAAKVAQGKASDDEQRELKILQDLRPAKEARFKNDPDGFGAASGFPPPQVDISNPDPGTVEARKSWARAFARHGGLVEPPYLSKDQLALSPPRRAGARGAVRGGAGDQVDVGRRGAVDRTADRRPGVGRHEDHARPQFRDRAALPSRRRGARKEDGRVRRERRRGPPDVRGLCARDPAGPAAGGVRCGAQDHRRVDAGTGLHQAAGQFQPGVRDRAAICGGAHRQRRRFQRTWRPRHAERPLRLAAGGHDQQGFPAAGRAAQPQDWVNAATDPRGNPVKSVPHYIGPTASRSPTPRATRCASPRARCRRSTPGSIT